MTRTKYLPQVSLLALLSLIQLSLGSPAGASPAGTPPAAKSVEVRAESNANRARFTWPVRGSVISRFGSRRLSGWHRGVDIKAPQGTPIRAAASGTVTFSGRQSSYGRMVKIDHANGLSTVYAHNSANLVRPGDHVQAGTPIATVGHTGRATTNHVHFEVRRQGVAKNPLPLLEQPAPAPAPVKRHEARAAAHHRHVS